MMAALTAAQLQALKADLAAAADLVGGVMVKNLPHTEDNAYAVAALYNLPAAGPFVVWRSAVPPAEYTGANGVVWTDVDNLTAGKARIFEWLTGRLSGAINAADPNVRAGLSQAFAGLATLTNLTALGKRNATRAEKLFAAGAGTDASPATPGWEGALAYRDIVNAWNSP